MEKYPKHLKIRGRKKLGPHDFNSNDLLYRGYTKNDLDDNGEIDTASIKFPDFSCNWSRFSFPKDIKYRENGSKKDGCYAFTVEIARYNNYATPVHDIIYIPKENYAHVEIRLLHEGESVFSEPPKDRKPKKTNIQRCKKLEYRNNIINNYEIMFEPM